MVTITFNVKEHRLVELQNFIKKNLPSARFETNPYKVSFKTYYVSMSMKVEDANKLNGLKLEWFNEDNKPKEKKKNKFFNFKWLWK